MIRGVTVLEGKITFWKRWDDPIIVVKNLSAGEGVEGVGVSAWIGENIEKSRNLGEVEGNWRFISAENVVEIRAESCSWGHGE